MVFDTTLWTTVPPPPPVLLTDSKAPGLTHQIVIKQFALNETITIETYAGEHGTATPLHPDLPIDVDHVFTITADPYYLIDELLIDGAPATISGDGSSYNYTWVKPQNNGVLQAIFTKR